MIFINNDELIIKVLRLRRVDPIGEYNFFLHYKMGNGFYNLTVNDTGDENTMVFIIPSSFTSTLPTGEYAYSIVKDSQVITSGVARKRELNFEADAVYSGTGDERTRYNVSIFASQGGYLMVNGRRYENYIQSVLDGQILTVRAVSEAGYTFSGWSDEVQDAERTILVSQDITLFATYEAAEYTVSISAGSNGSVSVNGVVGDYTATLAYGTVLTLVATPDEGYSFDTWSDGNTSNPRTLTVTGNVSLTSVYEEATQYFNVSIAAGQNGTVSVNGVVGNYSQTVAEGTVLTIQAIPNTGYNFTSWSDGNTDNPRTLTVTGNVNLTSAYEAQVQYYNVSISAGQNGTVSVNGTPGDYSQTVAEGTVLTLQAIPNTGYDFDSWSDSNTDNPRTLTVTGNVSLTSAYEAQTQYFNVSISAGSNGNVSVNGVVGNYSQSVAEGTVLTLEATADPGYDFTTWSDGNTDNPRTLTVDSTISLTSAYEAQVQYFNVSVSAGSNGSVSVDGTPGDYSETVAEGTVLTIEATADPGYDFDSWSDGNTDNPRNITIDSDISLTSAYEAQAEPSPLNTISYTTTDSQVNNSWLTAYDSDNNTLTPTETTTYGRIVFSEPVYKIVINTDNAANISSITTSYKTEEVAYSGTSNLSNCTSLTLKSPHMVSVDFTPFTALQSIWGGHANNDAQYTGVSNLPASGACTTRTDNNLWEHSDLSGWTFQALGTVITYEAQQQMDLTDHLVFNRASDQPINPASHTFADGVGTITYSETVGELNYNWSGCDKLYLPDTVGYFWWGEYLPQAMEVGEYFGVVGGSYYTSTDWNYENLFMNGLNVATSCAMTVKPTNPILTIGTDGCLYNKDNWMGLKVVNQTVVNDTVALLDMDDRCVDASTCLFNGFVGCPFTITRLVLGDSCESLKLYRTNYGDAGCVYINELVVNDALQTISPNGERILHASGGTNNPYLNVTNSGYTIESEDGSTLYWCGDESADLSGYTHFAEGCCTFVSFSSMPDISSATQIDSGAFFYISGVSTWVWPDNYILFNGSYIIVNTDITRMEFGNRSVTFNNTGQEGLFECGNLNTVVFNSTLEPTQAETGRDNPIFQNLPSSGTLYIPVGADYSTWLNYPSNIGNIGQWTVKYLLDGKQLAIRHTPGVTVNAPTLTGLTMVTSADSDGWLKVTYDNNIVTYDSTSLQNNADVLEVALPETCTSIGNGAFLGCSRLSKVHLSDNVTTVGNSAFYGTAINEFSAKGVTSFGSGAFGNCASLESVEFGPNLATLGNGLFYNCSILNYVGFDGTNGPTITNNDLGSGINGIGTIYIPMYANYASYADFIADMPVGWSVIRRKQNQILYQTTDGQQINVPSSINGSPLTSHIYSNGWGVAEYLGTRLYSMPEYGFFDNNNLSALYIPSIAANIETNSFGSCDSLTTIEIQDCSDIDWDAFSGSPIANGPDAGKLTLPPSVSHIWGGAFARLESSVIEFGPALHYIDANTLNLQNATDIYVYTAHTMDDGGNPFMNTPATGTLHMVDAADAAYWTQYLPGWTVVYDLGRKLYYTTTNSSVLAPYNVSAFSPATIVSNTYSGGQGVIEFDRDLVTFGGAAFADCTTLSSITLPRTVTTFVDNAQFERCTSLVSVTLPYGLTNIRNFSFNGCTSLASIEIPSTVTEIGISSFADCTSLTSVTIPGSVSKIDDQAFAGCTNLSSLTLCDGLERINTQAFAGTSLLSIHIPKTVGSMNSGAFIRCSRLTRITVDPANTVYDSRDNCNAVIETSTNTLLFGCKNTVIPNSVSSIGGGAFSQNEGLTAIVIPESVNLIRGGAFDGCINLASITFVDTTDVPSLYGNYIFRNVASTGTVYGQPGVDYSTIMAELPVGWTLVQ